jgi:hypothetical protein
MSQFWHDPSDVFATFGLDVHSFHVAERMLTARCSRADATARMSTLRSRFTLDYLPHHRTSRAGTLDHPLPTLHDEYWNRTRAHLYAGSLPPVFPESMEQHERPDND